MCPKCENRSFDTVKLGVKADKRSIIAVCCSACGAVMGVIQESNETKISTQLEEIQGTLKALNAQLQKFKK